MAHDWPQNKDAAPKTFNKAKSFFFQVQNLDIMLVSGQGQDMEQLFDLPLSLLEVI